MEIIGNSKSVLGVQRFLGKMFAGLSNVVSENQNKIITHMGSREGELISLNKSINIEESKKVEDWLESLESQMKTTLLD